MPAKFWNPRSTVCTRPLSILRLEAVKARVGLSRANIYRKMANGEFPAQLSLGGRAVGWLEHEIDAWIEERITTARGGVK